MNRRNFLGTLFGAAVAPFAVAKAIAAAPKSPMLVGFKGKQFLESGFIYAPYIPLQTTETIAPRRTFKAKWSVELKNDLQRYHGRSAEAEISKIIQDEIDREILRKFKVYG